MYLVFSCTGRITRRSFGTTHRYFIEELIGFPHPKIMLCSRFVKFYKTVSESKKTSIRLLANTSQLNETIIFRKNLSKIEKECKFKTDELSSYKVKNEMNYFPVPENESWRIPFLQNLLRIRSNEWTVDNFEDKEISDLIKYVCCT